MLQAAPQTAAAANISGISSELFMSGKSSPIAKAPQAPRKSWPSPPMFHSPSFERDRRRQPDEEETGR